MSNTLCQRTNCACIGDRCSCAALNQVPKDTKKCPFFKTVEQSRQEQRECRNRISALPKEQQAHIHETYYQQY